MNEVHYMGFNMRREKIKCVCVKHGGYEGEQILIGGRIVYEKSDCPVCEQEEWEAGRVEREREEVLRKKHLRELRLSNLIRQTRMPEEYRTKTFDQFLPDNQSQEAALNLSRRFVNGWQKAKAGGYGLLFLGSCGTGKTHLACAILHNLVEKANGKYFKACEVFSAIRRTYSSRSEKTEDDVLDFFSNIDLLVIDEIGVQKGSDAEKRILFSILDYRLSGNKPTILLTNLRKTDLKTLLGERLYDRVRSKCVPQLFTGESMRKPATPEVFG